ncbi:MAG: hypothetical protein ACTSRC_19065 [Candidatus Helarchaeota archaeon]
MNISEDERNYISNIYRHGLNHLVEDTIPNKLICVHNIHWCLEILLRKATETYPNLNYKDGFEKIFNEFAKNHKDQIPEEKSVLRFNTIRNDIEHRGIPPDINYLKEILPKIYKFIQWLMKTIFKTEPNIYTIPAVDERSVFNDFFEWKDKVLAKNLIDKIRDKDGLFKIRKDISLNDYLFICLIPSSDSEGLIDFSADNINDTITSKMRGGTKITFSNPEHHPNIEQYLRDYRILEQSQVYSIPKYVREYQEDLGDEIRIFPDGRIYICLNFAPLWSVKDFPDLVTRSEEKIQHRLVFNIEHLYADGGIIHNRPEAQKKYGTPIKGFVRGNLEHLLKIICFPFHPDCKIPMVKIPTTYFTGLFVFPLMLGFSRHEARVLYQKNPFGLREYLDNEENLVKKISFGYEEIPKIVIALKNYSYGFFKVKNDTAFM